MRAGEYGYYYKAFATLDRGPNYPYINVVSGYTQPDWPNVLDNGVWTDKAENLRAVLGLPEYRRVASHVEPQLLAYLAERHSLYPFDEEEDYQELKSVRPPYALRPIITVNKPDLCRHCFEFFEHFKIQFPGFNVIFHIVEDSIKTLVVRA